MQLPAYGGGVGLGEGVSVAEVEEMISVVAVGMIEGSGTDTTCSSVGLMSECN